MIKRKPLQIAALTLIASLSVQAYAGQATGELKDWPKIKSAVSKDAAMEKKIKDIVASMSLAQKVGQMTQAEIKFVTPEDVKKYYLGSVLNGGGSWPKMNKYATAADWLALSTAYYDASMSTDMKTPVPVIWGIDAIHGNSNVVGATLFPHNIGLGAAHNPQLLGKIAVEVGRAVRATGINWVFAPTVAVGKDARWGRAYESFSEDGKQVRDYAGVYVKGLQGNLKGDANVIATAKHFIGDGGTEAGVDRGVTKSTFSQMINSQAQGYYSAFEAGAQTVMASYNSWHDPVSGVNYGKMHGSKALLTEALKDKMGFDGFVISDWDGIAEVAGCSNDSCPQAINAGVDMIMVPDNWKNFIKNTIAQVEGGQIPMARIDDAVTRILRVKLRAGMFTTKPADSKFAGKQEAMQAKALARQAVRESLVLLKNNHNVLPLARGQKVLVVGKSADSMINQNGGWSITWQGTENIESDYHGDTLLAGFREALGASNVQYSPTAEGVDVSKFDTVIAVIGETPYAEGFGDIPLAQSLSHSQRHPEDLAVLKAVSGKGKPVVTVLLSGRAVYSNDLMNLSDSFVAGWLPGTEGKGVADVLFKDAKGKVAHDFKGRLSFSWPNAACLSGSIAQMDNKHPEKLFGLGYGLSYAGNKAAQKDLAPLAIDTRTSCADETRMAINTAKDSTHFPARATIATRQFTLAKDLNEKEMGGAIGVSSKTLANGMPARVVTWNGPAKFEATAPFSTMVPVGVVKDGVLQFVVEVTKAPQGKVNLAMECGDNCAASLDVTSLMQKLAGGAARTVKIPLSCFTAKGFDSKKIKSGFVMSSTAAFSAAIAEIELVGGKAKDADVTACSELN